MLIIIYRAFIYGSLRDVFKISYNVPLQLNIENLRDGQIVNSPSITIKGSVSSQCELSINGEQVELIDGNLFSKELQLKKGINEIKIDMNNNGSSLIKILKVNRIDPDENYVVYINWDGFAWYYYELANKDGISKTPVINSIIKDGVLFKNCYTGIPSITNPMQNSIVSGAWPNVTGNCYRYYDKKSQTVIQFGRENKAETIGEAAVRQGLKIASIQQFILQNRGTIEGDINKPYIQYENADYSKRFDIAIKLIKGETIKSGNKDMQIDEIPRFISIYMDDLDGIGHNGGITYGIFPSKTEKDRLKSIIKRLEQMDKKLGEFIDVCKSRGIYDNMSFVLTSDHGMTPYGQQGEFDDGSGFSKLPDLMDAIRGLGYKVEVLSGGQRSKADTDIVIVTAGLEVQLSFTHEYSEKDLVNIIRAVERKPYIGIVMKKDEMSKRGVSDDFADLLISPKPPYFFSTSTRLFRARGQHDSLDKTSQHIFSVMWGKGIKKGYMYNERTSNIDFAKTMAKLLNIDGPANATGCVLNDALINSD